MITIINDSEGNPIGWSVRPKTEEEQVTAGIMRDLTFFGIDDTHIEYDGLKLIDPEKGKQHGNILCLTWMQKKYCD